MKSLEPIIQNSRVEAVLGELAAFIGDSGIGIGDRLPTERHICEALGVSRSTVREVLRQWQALGVVDMRKGSGTYLLKRISADTIYLPLVLENRRAGLMQMLEVRRGLETEASALAATRATPEAIADLKAKLEAMEAVFAREGCAGPEDLTFHLAIYEACGNPVFGQLLSQMRDSVSELFSISYVLEDMRDFASRSFPFHRPLFEAIAGGDPDAARANTHAILDIVEEDVRTMTP